MAAPVDAARRPLRMSGRCRSLPCCTNSGRAADGGQHRVGGIARHHRPDQTPPIDRRRKLRRQPAAAGACRMSSVIIRCPLLDEEGPLREHSAEAMLKPPGSIPG